MPVVCVIRSVEDVPRIPARLAVRSMVRTSESLVNAPSDDPACDTGGVEEDRVETCRNCGSPVEADGWVVTLGAKDGAVLTDDHSRPDCGARFWYDPDDEGEPLRRNSPQLPHRSGASGQGPSGAPKLQSVMELQAAGSRTTWWPSFSSSRTRYLLRVSVSLRRSK